MKNYTHIFFDMGNVLVDYVPLNFITERTTNPADIYTLTREIFLSEEWRGLDHGSIALDDAARGILSRVPPHLVEDAQHLIYHWHDYMTPVDAMLEIVKALKEKGYTLYILSNAPLAFSEFKDRIPAMQYFDHHIVSAFIKRAKPDPAFFQYVLDTYKLNPEDCFFIDDLLKNVLSALSLGIDAYLYNGNPQKLEQFLTRVQIL